MKKTKTDEHGNKSTNGFTAERFFFIVPKIISEFIKDGTRYYKGDNGKIYLADVYDLKLSPPKLAVKQTEISKRSKKDRKYDV